MNDIQTPEDLAAVALKRHLEGLIKAEVEEATRPVLQQLVDVVERSKVLETRYEAAIKAHKDALEQNVSLGKRNEDLLQKVLELMTKPWPEIKMSGMPTPIIQMGKDTLHADVHVHPQVSAPDVKVNVTNDVKPADVRVTADVKLPARAPTKHVFEIDPATGRIIGGTSQSVERR